MYVSCDHNSCYFLLTVIYSLSAFLQSQSSYALSTSLHVTCNTHDDVQRYSQMDLIVDNLLPQEEDPTLISFKFEFLKIISVYEHFHQINTPVRDVITTIPTVVEDFRYVFFVYVLIFILDGLHVYERTYCVTVLCSLLMRIVCSKRHYLSSMIIDQVTEYLGHSERTVWRKVR